MNILQVQQIGIREGNESAEFYADYPHGLQRCVWIDAEQGLFESVGLSAGYSTVDTVLRQYPELHCYPVEIPNNVIHSDKFKQHQADANYQRVKTG